MGFLVVSGMSGAGRTRASGFLEDMGFFVTGNLPPAMILPWAECCRAAASGKAGYVLLHGMSAGTDVAGFLRALDGLRRREPCRTLFLDADAPTVIRRYKETRRRHPLWDGGGTMESMIARERELLAPVRERADDVVDTSGRPAAFLRDELRRLYGKEERI